MLLPWQPSLLRRPMLEKGVFSLIFLGVPGHQSARCSLPGLACSREGPAEPAHGRRIPGRGRRSSRSLLFPSWSGQLPLRVTTGRAGREVPPPQSRGARAPPHRTVGWEWVPPFPTDGQGVAQACGAVRGEGRARRVALPLSPVRCPPLTVRPSPRKRASPGCALQPPRGPETGRRPGSPQRHSWCGMLAWWPLLGPTELPAAGLSACPPRRRWASGTVLREPPWPGRARPGGPKVSEECSRGITPRGALRPAPAGTPRVPSPANGPNPTQGDVRPYGRTRPPCWVAEGHTAPSSRVLP